eukprot:363215-Chlamydomonas_euryale.AAC.3
MEWHTHCLPDSRAGPLLLLQAIAWKVQGGPNMDVPNGPVTPPLTSNTVKSGPKSVNTLANTPRVSARIKAIAGDCLWQNSSIRLLSAKLPPVTTTTCNTIRARRAVEIARAKLELLHAV